ncbi:DUF397 domain-containing protein [Embleya sp. NBC_00896]|uniref:DUF397 domain-containing protein n=1 Tax=Embleya sp. NBC_00896 TaxID=2975961 RepID=UPI0038651F50|nr:DUF397 domain-containing protein [Embleya sp. NBC_00896]
MSIDQYARSSTGLLWIKSSYSGSEGGDCVEVAWRKSSHSGNEGGQCVEVAWRKSCYSGNEGGDCVEVAWRKSPHSGSEGGQCVEVAACTCVHVRDSKVAAGPILDFGHDQWHTFLARAEA